MSASNGEPAARTALVTGAGSGIGRAVALGLADDGFDLLLTGRRTGPLADVASEVASRGRGVQTFAADLSNREEADALAAWAARSAPRLDALVLNAGLGGPSPLEDPLTFEFDRRIEINLAAPFRLVRELLPRVPRDGGGRIVFVASVLARFGVPDYHAYAASKAGLVGLARALAKDLGPKKIAVNAVLPGWTRTDMAERSWTVIGGLTGGDARAGEAAAMKDVPAGRPAEAAEIAGLVRYLVSPAAALVMGQAVVLDGGACA